MNNKDEWVIDSVDSERLQSLLKQREQELENRSPWSKWMHAIMLDSLTDFETYGAAQVGPEIAFNFCGLRVVDYEEICNHYLRLTFRGYVLFDLVVFKPPYNFARGNWALFADGARAVRMPWFILYY